MVDGLVWCVGVLASLHACNFYTSRSSVTAHCLPVLLQWAPLAHSMVMLASLLCADMQIPSVKAHWM